MIDPALTTLAAVRQRLRFRRLLRGSTAGLLGGALLGLLSAGAVIAVGAPQYAASLAGLGLCVGLVGGLGGAAGKPPSWRAAAETVDRYYAMKDRTVTALAFAQAATGDPLQRLQIADTAAHLQKVRPADCVPMTISGPLQSAAVCLLGVTVAVAAYAHCGLAALPSPPPAPLAVAQAASLQESLLAEVASLAEESGREELERLQEELTRLTDQLAGQVRDPEDYFATLSAMEQAIEEARDALQTAETAAELQSLAEAIRPAEAMQGAAEALAGKEYQRAAQELQTLDPEAISEQDRRAVSENLQERNRQPSDAKDPTLQEAAEQLQQGLQQRDDAQTRQATKRMAEAAQQQAVAEALDDRLAQQLQQLSEAKGRGRNHGQSPSDLAQKTDSPSQSWGKAASGNPEEGQTNALEARRDRQELRGQLGEGLSEKEMVAAEASEQTAQRDYRERYQTFRQQAEATLEQETLPAGQRETIRRYFESIRPASN